MSKPWPPPPDLNSLNELVATADIESFLADGGPADEYEVEAEHLHNIIGTWPTAHLTTERLLPVLEAIWTDAFGLGDPTLDNRPRQTPRTRRPDRTLLRPASPTPGPQRMSDRDSLWRQRLSDYLQANANPPHKFGHQPRLYALTQTIAANSPGLTYDDDVVFAAAYLHDLGVFLGHRPEDPETLKTWDHVAYACEHAPTLLATFGFPTQKTEKVLAAIREHQPHDDPQTPEATLLRDADILEQLGGVAVLRTASKLGSDTRFHLFTDARNALQRALATLPNQLRLPASHALAQPRIHTLQTFLAALDSEAGPHLH